MSKIKTIGILTSGGDAPGMNAAIRALTRSGIYNGFKIKGIYRGYDGLIHDEVKEFTTEDVSGIITRTFTYKAEEKLPAAVCTVNEGEVCAFFEAPVTWGAIGHTWAWMKGRDGKEYLGVEWPGVNATLLGKAANGNKVFKWVSTKTTAPDNIIFSGAGGQTKDLPFVNAGYYTVKGLKAIVPDVPTAISLTTRQLDDPSAVYDLQGRRISGTPAKGIYIFNNRKAVVR